MHYKRFVVLALLAILLLGSASLVLAQQSGTVDYNSNLRQAPTTKSSVIAVVPQGTALELIDSAVGESLYGNSLWYQVSYHGSVGYIWSGLITSGQQTADSHSSSYPITLCSTCGYLTLSIHNMRLLNGAVRQNINDPPSFLAELYSLPARSVWIGYENGGFDMPDDVYEDFTILFRAESNYIPGPLMYQGQVLPDLTVTDDELMIWFGYSPSTGEEYVFAFRSLTRTCTAAGQHCGEHLWGAYAIPKSAADNFVARYET